MCKSITLHVWHATEMRTTRCKTKTGTIYNILVLHDIQTNQFLSSRSQLFLELQY